MSQFVLKFKGTTVLEEIMSEKKRESGSSDVLPLKVSVMKPILRCLQLLCENHNPELQVTNAKKTDQPHPEGREVAVKL